MPNSSIHDLATGRTLSAEDAIAASLQSGDGGGTYDGMDGWQQSVENRLGELRQDIHELRSAVNTHFLFLLAAIGGSFVALLGVMMSGFGWIG